VVRNDHLMSAYPSKADIYNANRMSAKCQMQHPTLPRPAVFFEMFDETQLNSPLEPDNDHECRLPHRDDRIAIRLA
jgi:hypothetical protein